MWFDYLTSEPPKAEKYFRTLFGWTFQTMTMSTGPYTLIMNNGVAIGGVQAPLPDTPTYRYSEPYSRWSPHLIIENGHEGSGKVKTRGGKVLREPSALLDMGRLVVALDANGTGFSMRQPATVQPDPGWAGPPNSFCWAELYTLNTSSSVAFYKAIIGFTETKSPLPDGTYHMLEKGGVPQAGVRLPMPGVQTGWFAWVRVPDLVQTVHKAQQLDSTVIMPPGNNMALLVDPYGCTLGLAQA